MKLVFYGDSITDMGRDRVNDNTVYSYGNGYVRTIADELLSRPEEQYEILNRGVSGDRVVDLYARIKKDVWNLAPDALTILVGINDVWHEVANGNGVDLKRYENIYDLMIRETLERLPDTKIILIEPFVLKGSVSERFGEDGFEKISYVREYAKAVKRIADKYNLSFVAMQDKLDGLSAKRSVDYYLADGVHPNIAGATLIAREWLKCFDKIK